MRIGNILAAAWLVFGCVLAVGAGDAREAVAASHPRPNTPPTASITAPVHGATFINGEVVSLVGSAADAEDASDHLKYQWVVDLLADPGVHARVLSVSGRTASFVARKADDAGEAAFQIQLVVTDSGRMRDTAMVTIHPRVEPESVSPVAAGDVLDVQIYAGGEKQEEFTAEVTRTGTITSPLIGEVNVSGLKTTEIADKLTQMLAKDFFVDPQVLVSLKESSGKIYVSGEVKRPGVYDLKEGLKAFNACILAGGFTNYAALGKVRITRTENGRARTIELDLAKVQKGKKEDLVLQSGDRIDVPPRRF